MPAGRRGRVGRMTAATRTTILGAATTTAHHASRARPAARGTSVTRGAVVAVAGG